MKHAMLLLGMIALNLACQSPGYQLVMDAIPEKDWPDTEQQWLRNVRQLTSEDMGIGASGEAYFSPDMKRIIFQSYPRGQHEYQMFTLELTGDFSARSGSLRQVSPGGGACTCGYFRPDGLGILYASSYLNPDLPNPNYYRRSGSSYTWNMPGGMDILAANLDGSNPKRLTTENGYDAECSYSPDGRLIVFSSDRAGNPDLYVMNSDGSGVQRLTDKPGYDGGPFFSPDGKRIIFRADRRQNDMLQLFVIDADGKNERQITRDGPVVNWAPYWLPSGKSVVFTTSLHGHRNYEVYVMNIETGAHQRITYSPRFDGLPVVSPDGSKMMWTSQRAASGTSQIFLADFTIPAGY